MLAFLYFLKNYSLHGKLSSLDFVKLSSSTNFHAVVFLSFSLLIKTIFPGSLLKHAFAILISTNIKIIIMPKFFRFSKILSVLASDVMTRRAPFKAIAALLARLINEAQVSLNWAPIHNG